MGGLTGRGSRRKPYSPMKISIADLVVEEAYRHIWEFGCVKDMHPPMLEILKTSNDSKIVAMRNWMRQTALEQHQQAEREQKIMSDELAAEPVNKKASVRRSTVIHPYFIREMEHRHKASFGDRDFLDSIKEANPKLFPKREG